MNNSKSVKKGLLTSLDNVFVVNGEMIPENGEDSFAYSVNDNYGFIGVFDGCGGIGSRKYATFKNKSGAYISSRVTSSATVKWFDGFLKDNLPISGNSIYTVCDSLKEKITSGLKAVENSAGGSTIKGSLAKSLPTTVSMVLFSADKDCLYSAFIWAGDSRGFVLTSDGLCQLTKDDIESEDDAMLNLSNDSKLSNVVSASGDFKLNSRIVTCEGPSVIITATDGCFGYFATPMEFEFMLVETLKNSNSINQWKQNIDKYIRTYTADDYTLCVALYGYKNFKTLKKAYEKRREELFKKYISKLGKVNEQGKNHLWNEYKQNYYRGV